MFSVVLVLMFNMKKRGHLKMNYSVRRFKHTKAHDSFIYYDCKIYILVRFKAQWGKMIPQKAVRSPKK